MSRIAARITCDENDRQILERRAASRTEPRQVVERARIILGCVTGARVKEIALRCQTRPNTVIKEPLKNTAITRNLFVGNA